MDRKALRAGFTPAVFAADRALELVAEGMPFRDAYRQVRSRLHELCGAQPAAALRRKTHLGAPAGLVWSIPQGRLRRIRAWEKKERRTFERAAARLMGVDWAATREQETR